MGRKRRVERTGWAGRLQTALAVLVLAVLVLAVAGARSAAAAEPLPWQLGMQPPASPVGERMDGLHDGLLVLITLIVLFVLGMLVYVMVRFNAKAHPVPSKVTHNTALEIVWTGVPILILLGVAIPSFKLLHFVGRTPHADMTIKVTGHQWYWEYEYPDQADLKFDSQMIPEADAVKNGKKRLLDVDSPLVLPVGTNIRLLVEGADVIHSWFVPSMGVQVYAVVGRANESWMNIERAGTYYGECNQICGINHPFMPIEIKAVSKGDFARWLAESTKKAAQDEDRPGPRSGRPSLPGLNFTLLPSRPVERSRG